MFRQIDWVVKLESVWFTVGLPYTSYSHLSLLTLHSSLIQVQDCHHFPKLPLLIVLVTSYSSFSNQKTIPSRGQQFLVETPFLPIHLSPSLGLYGLTLSILVQQTITQSPPLQWRLQYTFCSILFLLSTGKQCCYVHHYWVLSQEAPALQLRPDVFHCWLNSLYSTAPVSLVGQYSKPVVQSSLFLWRAQSSVDDRHKCA